MTEVGKATVHQDMDPEVKKSRSFYFFNYLYYVYVFPLLLYVTTMTH